MRAFILAALVAVPVALAQTPDHPPDPAADPAAAVPAPQYRSVLQDTPRGVEDGAGDWRQANAEVARFPRGHIDLLKWEAAQAAAPGQQAPASAQPAARKGSTP